MSRSRLKDKWMKMVWNGNSLWAKRFHIKQKNKHRQDEKPKNHPSKLVATHCSADVAWLQESGSFGGHSIPKGGHRKVSGLVRASLKEEARKQIDEVLKDLDINI